MTEIIRLNRFGSSPWGFRLTGGSDYRTWLSVVKVIGGSIAELGGVKVGDIVVEINGQSTKYFTHTDAQNLIGVSRNVLTLTIVRGSLFEKNVAYDNEKISMETENDNVQSLEDELGNVIEPQDYKCYIKQAFGDEPQEVQPCCQTEITPDDTDIQIAGILSGNEEVLEEGIMGINFKKFMPQVDFIRQSEVFKYLQNENTKGEVPEEVQLMKEPTKRFSTFLQKPKPSQPNSKEQLWHYPVAPRYLPREKRKVEELPKRRPKNLKGHTVLWLFLGESCEHVVDERWGNDEEEKMNLNRCAKCSKETTLESTNNNVSSEKDNRLDESEASDQLTEKAEEQILHQHNIAIENEVSSELTSNLSNDVETKITEEEFIGSLSEKVVDSSLQSEEQVDTESVEIGEQVSQEIIYVEEFSQKIENIKAQILALQVEAPRELEAHLTAIQIQLEEITMKPAEYTTCENLPEDDFCS